MNRIFYIIGKSASGKDSVYKSLLADLHLNPIVTYTTRPIREGEKDGREYYFVSRETLDDMESRGEVIEKRIYNTVHGEWIYFTAKNSVKSDDCDIIGIGTLESFVKIRAYFGAAVIPIYIEVDDGVRLERAVKRERSQKEPKYKELCRRFLADSDDFSEENLSRAGIERRFVNDDFDFCISEIKKYISGEIE